MQHQQSLGRRAEKARETHQRIAGNAVRLFLERGYEETTIEAITQAAQVSRRTFFHYFESKLAVLQAVEEGMEDEFRQEIFAVPLEIPPIEAVRRALLGTIARYYNTDHVVALDRLMRSTEALRAQRQANYEMREGALALILAERWPDHPSPYALQMVALIAIGALRVAADRWNQSAGKEGVAVHFEAAFESLLSETGRWSSEFPK